jgi:hypothetical protein
MDQFELIDRDRSRKRLNTWIWNILTLLVVLATVCLLGSFVYIYNNPQIEFNLFPPAELPEANALPTLTPTALHILPATWTPTATATPTATNTPEPTFTLTPTETPIPQLSATATLTGTLSADQLPFKVSSGSPAAISSLTFHPEAGCNWMGVGGQALDMSGAPITSGLVVKLGGVLAGAEKDFTGLTGTALQYGEAGYEIVIASKPIASSNTLWIQLVDVAGMALSPQVYFTTLDGCDKNLLIINFQQIR